MNATMHQPLPYNQMPRMILSHQEISILLSLYMLMQSQY